MSELETKMLWIELLCNDIHEATMKPEVRLKELADGDLRQTGMDILARGILGILKADISDQKYDLSYLLKHKKEQDDDFKKLVSE